MDLLNAFSLATKIVTGFSLCVSVPLYIAVIVIVFRNRRRSPFNSHFFVIYNALGIVDLVCYGFYVIKKCPYWNIELPIFTPFDQPNIYMKILYFGIWWFAFCQFQLIILISLNRFVSIVLRHIYLRYWTLKVTHLLIAFVVLETAALAMPIWFTGSTVATTWIRLGSNNVTRHSGPVFIEAWVGSAYNTAWKVHTYTIIAVCCVCYSIMFFTIRGFRTKNKAVRTEIRLMYSALILFAANLLYVGYFAFRDVMVAQYNEFGKYTEWTLYLLADIYDLNNVYALLLTSREVRRILLGRLGLQAKESSLQAAKSVVIVTSPSRD